VHDRQPFCQQSPCGWRHTSRAWPRHVTRGRFLFDWRFRRSFVGWSVCGAKKPSASSVTLSSSWVSSSCLFIVGGPCSSTDALANRRPWPNVLFPFPSLPVPVVPFTSPPVLFPSLFPSILLTKKKRREKGREEDGRGSKTSFPFPAVAPFYKSRAVAGKPREAV